MNQGFPPGQPPPSRGGRGEKQNPFAPANVVMALVRQSELRYSSYGEFITKQDQGFRQLQMDCQTMAITIQSDPASLNRLGMSLQAALRTAAMNRMHLEQQMQVELFLQGELKRWLVGQPPTAIVGPEPPQAMMARGQRGASPNGMMPGMEANVNEGGDPQMVYPQGPPPYGQGQPGMAPQQRMPPQRMMPMRPGQQPPQPDPMSPQMQALAHAQQMQQMQGAPQPSGAYGFGGGPPYPRDMQPMQPGQGMHPMMQMPQPGYPMQQQQPMQAMPAGMAERMQGQQQMAQAEPMPVVQLPTQQVPMGQPTRGPLPGVQYGSREAAKAAAEASYQTGAPIAPPAAPAAAAPASLPVNGPSAPAAPASSPSNAGEGASKSS